MILPRRLALEEPFNDRRLGFPVGERSRDQRLFDVLDHSIFLAADLASITTLFE
jgi:hypothetical protein